MEYAPFIVFGLLGLAMLASTLHLHKVRREGRRFDELIRLMRETEERHAKRLEQIQNSKR